MELDKIWRVVTANFLLLTGIACLVLAFAVLRDTVLAAVAVYGAFILIFWGVVRGLFAIIDHNREVKEKE